MTSYYIGADRCNVGEGGDMNKIASALRKLGHNVTVGGIGPNQEGVAHGVSKSKTFLYLVCGVPPATIWSFKQAVAAGTIPKTIFIHSGWTSHDPSSPLHSEKQMLNYSFIPEYDAGQFMTSSSVASMKKDAGNAKTVGDYCRKYSKYVGVCWASSPQEAAQKIHNGQVTGYGSSGSYSGTSSGSSSNGGGSSGDSANGNASSGSSPLLTGEMTFEELVGEICNGIDLLFLTKRTTVVVDDFESIFAEAKYLRDNNSKVVEAENVKLWQLEEDSYEMEVNQHGFYNTVYVNYKNGVVKESYDEFVRVYGEIPIRYKHPTLDKTNAIAKAKAYLAAHIRDFNMVVNLTMLADGDIDIGDIITVENPQTMNNANRIAHNRDPEYLFVKGRSISWEGDQDIMADLECTYAPESPERKDVPTAGTSTGTNSKGESDNKNDSASGAGTKYNKCGVSSDGKTVCGVGRPSAPGESSKYGYTFYQSVFKNKCPFCGKATIIYDIFWAGENSSCGYSKCKGSSECGSIEGHFFCTNCDADFSIIDGADHMNPPRNHLSRVSGPTKATKQDAYKIKKGIFST